MTSIALTQSRSKWSSPKKWLPIAGLTLLMLIIAGGFTWYYTRPQSNLPPVVSLEEFEAFSGISPKMVAVTASGGIVDLRYRVIDETRAMEVMSDTALFPRLIVNDTEQVLVPGMQHLLNAYIPNATYFVFFPNVNSVVQTGTELSIMVGDTRYGPIIAK